MEEKPNYYAVIPADVRYDNNLSASVKLMYGEITALAKKSGECWASNNYFAELYGKTPQSISWQLKQLEKHGYISVEYVYKGKEIEKRIIKLVSNKFETYQIDLSGVSNKFEEGYQINFKENNTSINNTSINKKEIYKERYFESDKLNKVFQDYIEMRKAIKKPMTPSAKEIAVKKLRQLANDDEAMMIAILEQSIMNSWQGLFPLKQERIEFGVRTENEKRETMSAKTKDTIDSELNEILKRR